MLIVGKFDHSAKGLVLRNTSLQLRTPKFVLWNFLKYTFTSYLEIDCYNLMLKFLQHGKLAKCQVPVVLMSIFHKIHFLGCVSRWMSFLHKWIAKKKNPIVLNSAYFYFRHSITSSCRFDRSFAKLCLVFVVILALPLHVFTNISLLNFI